MEHVVNEIECFLNNIECDLKIAIMGCVVNGPGEAREADLGIAGGNGVGVIFKKGQILKKVNEDLLVPELEKEIIAMIKAIKE
jgi:(E)-4-hydroxy-3-methylbut-2-enyl-diphosphate synthase